MAGAIDPQHDPLTDGQKAALGAFATLVGGGLAGLAGANAQAGAQAGQNEGLNNTGDHWGNRRLTDPSLHNPSEQAELDSQENDTVRLSPGHMPTQQEEEGGDFTIKPGGGPLLLSAPSSSGSVRVGGGSAFEVDVGTGANNWSDGNQSVTNNVGGSTANGIDFYVNSQGTALPATGYRYMGSQYTQQTQSTMTAPLSYFGFTNYPTAAGALNGYQIDPIQFNNDATLKGTFDTLQLFGQNGFVNARVPLANGGAGPGLEPFTASYPELGSGGQAQLVPVLPGTTVQLKGVTVIPKK